MAYDRPGRGKGRSFSSGKPSGRFKREDSDRTGRPGRPGRSFGDDASGEKKFSRGRSQSKPAYGERRDRNESGPPRRPGRPGRSFGDDASGEKKFSRGRSQSKPAYGERRDRNESGGPSRRPFKSDRTDRPERTERPGFRRSGFSASGPGGPRRTENREDRPKEERRKSEFYGKPFARPERRRRINPDEDNKKSFVQSRLEKQRKFISEKSDDSDKPESEDVRLNKFISNSGICSRREADNLISMGLVTVNGQTITEMGHKVKRTDDVRYEGKKLTAERPVYILLNKPKGFITTTEDPQERNTVMNLIAGACKERVYPVGRLDRNTTGLLLFTNDGELADKLTHPSYNVRKIYKVDLDRPLTKADFEKIREGVRLEEGRAMVDDLAIVDETGKSIGIELHIGWNRIVRRIFESLDYQILKLDRVVYAGLDKKDLQRGKWRFLKDTEIIKLKHFNKK
jgi:23S rRNA pseudouridine2605 synthase